MYKKENDMVECPYNKSHVMLRKRLQSHLLKCRLQHPNTELMKCPFNATHLLPEQEFAHHVSKCPDRKLITQYKYDAPSVKQDEDVPYHKPIESEDNWDDTDVADYDPTKYTESAEIIRFPEGETPSERKLFIKKERKRLGDPDTDDEDEYGVIEVPSYNDNRERERSSRSRSPNDRGDRSPPTPPPPPIYSAAALRERDSYNLDDDPYYNLSLESAHSRDNRSNRYSTKRDETHSTHSRSNRGHDAEERPRHRSDRNFERTSPRRRSDNGERYHSRNE